MSSNSDITSWPRYVVFGEALTDFVRTGDGTWRSSAGGACWNVARVASMLGLPTAWSGAVSSDLFGQELLLRSREAGLDTRFIQSSSRAPLLAMVHQSDPPQYFFVGDGAADLDFDAQRMPQGWHDDCELAHFGSISLVRQPLGERLIGLAGELKSAGKKISFDPNYRSLMSAGYAGTFERMLRLADIIKISDEDLAGIYRGVPRDLALARVRSLAPEAWLIFTRGKAGLTVSRGQESIEQPCFHVTAVDTVGAGDACLGGFVVSLLIHPTMAAASHARFAAAVAAAACTRAGPYAPTRDEVERLLSRGELDLTASISPLPPR